MPNWCQNAVYIGHSDEAMMDRVEDAYTRGELFNEFIPVPEDLKNPGASSWGGESAAANDAIRAANKSKHGYDSWYDFCVEQWGTKWDVGGEDEHIIRGDEHNIVICFDSAWAPPLAAFEKMLELGFTIKAYYWEAGMCFAGVWDNGEDDYYDYGQLSVKEIEDLLPEDLDHEFNIVQNISDWQESG